ncbi:IclR family transcriptional regulator domain-containing protein [Saccharopolyspora soli]|uniref:IclR family transcriptional regulator domain-containing protein n=1 Tax=Saccharopolyspora soli TaxID=2926618 RepID=UPI0024138769|nr:IclR family transcriptional regulator C-terminal domain-containing protein [Saccharopolyspora soli]
MREVARDVGRGWAVSNQEIDEGVWAASAPVTEVGRTVAAVSAPCLAFRLDEKKRALVIDLVQKTALQISNALGA